MPTNVIRIPEERYHQLHRLAEHRQVSLSDLIGDLVTSEIDREGLTLKIGIGTADICKLENGNIWFSSPDIGNFEWTESVALSVADSVEKMSKGIDAPKRYLDVDAGILITRVGRGIRIDPFVAEGEGRAFSQSLARDLAKFIRLAVAETL